VKSQVCLTEMTRHLYLYYFSKT